MNDMYLIPANSKKSLLIFGMFNKIDLIIFASGIVSTLILSTFMPVESLVFAVLTLMPAAIGLLLVFPIPNYHNVLTALKSMYQFFTERKEFIWKCWCISDEEE